MYLSTIIKAKMLGSKFDDVDNLPMVVHECIRKILTKHFRTCYKPWVHKWENVLFVAAPLTLT